MRRYIIITFFKSREHDTMRSEDSVLVQSVDLGSGQEAWRSLSCLTDSTEQSAPVNFDLSNRVSQRYTIRASKLYKIFVTLYSFRRNFRGE